jgi:long-chain acyl-CoA synthetase
VKASLRICDVIEPWVVSSPEHTALVDATGRWTYAQLAQAVSETQVWLRGSGVRPGDRVMVMGENCRAFAAVLLAVAGLDTWCIPVNPRLSAREIDAIRDHCDAKRVVYLTAASTHAEEHAKRNGAFFEEVGDLGSVGIGPLNESAQPEAIDDDAVNRIAVLVYTSGTTGVPKGVMLRHRNLLFSAGGSAKIRSMTPKDRVFGVLPLSHIVGLSVLLGTLVSGSTLYLAARFDPMAARVSLEKDGITIMLGVPSMFSQFLQYAKIRKLESLKFSALRIISCSGAPLPPATKLAVENLLGLPLHHAYGITECGPTVAQIRPEAPVRSDTAVGPILPGSEIRLVGADGKTVPAGEVGELWVRSPGVMKGYYRAPDETAAAINAEGWFNTRDLARLEGDNLFIVGRTKDLIIRFGFNVYPAEVEAVLNSHPAVARSAVIGRMVEGDEEIIAFVQPLPGASLTALEIAEYAAKHLAAYKRPSHILFLTEMPVTVLGKIMKPELAKIAAELPQRGQTSSARLIAEPRSATDLHSQNPSAAPSQTLPAK